MKYKKSWSGVRVPNRVLQSGNPDPKFRAIPWSQGSFLAFHLPFLISIRVWSPGGEVLLELLIQKQTSNETKNCTLKCLKWHYVTLRLLTNSCRLIGNRAFALFFRPHRGEFVIQGQKKKCWCPGVSPGGTWAQRELTDTFISKMVVELSKNTRKVVFWKIVDVWRKWSGKVFQVMSFLVGDDLIGSATGCPMMMVKCSVTQKKNVTHNRFRKVVYNKEDVLNCSFS